MNYLYIDANIYLKFYLGNKLFKMLETLVDNKTNVIVTKQITNEVFRNSVSVNINNLTTTTNALSWNKPSLPYKNASTETSTLINSVYEQFKNLRKQIEEDLEKHLTLVSTQKDDVTQKLKELFGGALEPTDAELENAEMLKKFGNPPGKKADPIGDELSWVQVLNKIQSKDKLVIVTNDRDYASVFNKKSYLNSKLHQDLEDNDVEYFVYSEINEGIKKLKELQEQSHSEFETKDFPTEEEQEAIKEEEQTIVVKKVEETCKHQHIAIRPNGIFDNYFCMGCNRVVYRQYSDDLD